MGPGKLESIMVKIDKIIVFRPWAFIYLHKNKIIRINTMIFFPGDRGRRRSKFVLYRRQKANGVSRSRHYKVKTPQTSQAILNTQQHSISYTLSRNQAVIVEYTHDDNTDLFQVSSFLY